MGREIRAGIVLLVSLCVLWTMTNCDGDETPTYEVIERGSSQGKPVITELPMSNCDSDAALITSQKVDQKYTHEVEILRGPNSDDNPSDLAKVVRQHYLCPSNEPQCNPPLVEVASYTVAVNVPPNSIFTYEVEWTEVWRSGDIEKGEIDNSPEATYKFLETVTGGVIGIKTATCP